MAARKSYLHSKIKYHLGIIAMLLLVFSAGFSLTGNNDFDLARQQLLLRKIGHELLLRSGDTASRVLPVKKLGSNIYEIRFEKELTFQTDSLVKIVSATLSDDNLSDGYIVNVLNCSGKDVVFGYAISGNKKKNIVSCSRRKQPKDCYLIQVTFQSAGLSAIQKGCLIGGIPLLAFVGLLISRSGRGRKSPHQPGMAGELKLGNTLFDPQQKILVFEGRTITLTSKESRLLFILASHPNVTIERGRLQKELWEDEGVIVGRSLDMFISRLRKKLESDGSIKLKNIHGKGYKLETGV